MLICQRNADLQPNANSEEDIDWTQVAQVYPNVEEMPAFITRQHESAAEHSFTSSADSFRNCHATFDTSTTSAKGHACSKFKVHLSDLPHVGIQNTTAKREQHAHEIVQQYNIMSTQVVSRAVTSGGMEIPESSCKLRHGHLRHNQHSHRAPSPWNRN